MRRLWLDANVVLRLLTGIPESMAQRSLKLVKRAEKGEVLLILSSLIVAEIVWVLKSQYRRSSSEIAEVLIPFLHSDGLEAEEKEILVRSMELSRDRNVEFIDAYLSLKAQEAGQEVCTFDETDFKKLPSRWVAPPAY